MYGTKLTVERLIKVMDECGVDKTLAYPLVSYAREPAEDNRAIAQGMKKYPERIIGFGGLNPRLGMEKAMDELRRCIEEYGVKGFKLNGARDEFYIDDPKLVFPLIEKASQSGAVMAFHSGANDAPKTHPWRVGNIARAFPETRILMLHMGGVGLRQFSDSAIKMAQQFPNINIVGTEADPKAIRRAIEVLGASRVCYGSDEPYRLMKVSLAQFKALLEDLSTSDRELVMGENILRILSQ